MATDAEFVAKLLAASQRGRVDWKKTAVKDQYAAAFGGKWTVTVDQAGEEGAEVHWLMLQDSEGQELLKIFAMDDNRIATLFEAARRHALKVNEALADVLKDLDKT